MSEDTTVNLPQNNTLITQATDFLTSQKGLYFGVVIVLAVCIYLYYTKVMKAKQEKNDESKEQVQEPENQVQEPENQVQEYEPPPGYVAVPEDVLDQLQYQAQLGQKYANFHQDQNNNNQQNDEAQEDNYLEEEEDENIQEQNLTNQEKQSVRQQMTNIAQ